MVDMTATKQNTTGETMRAALIRRMATEIRVAVRQCPATDIDMASCELLDNRSRPYGRQFAELGYDDNARKAKRFFSDLRKAVSETF